MSEPGSVASRPVLRVTSVTIGAGDVDEEVSFWSRFLDEPLTGREVGEDGVVGWAQLRAHWEQGRLTINVEHEAHHVPPVWPSREGESITQVHLDIWVEDLDAATAWALECGARLAEAQPQADIRVLLDPAGHPFCLFL